MFLNRFFFVGKVLVQVFWHHCPRDWRLSASWGPIEGSLETPLTSQHCDIVGFKGGLSILALVRKQGRSFWFHVLIQWEMHTINFRFPGKIA